MRSLFHCSTINEQWKLYLILCYNARVRSSNILVKDIIGKTIMRQLYHPTRDDIMLTGVLYALSDPIRLQIVADLAGSAGQRFAEKSCGTFEINIAKSTLSHHCRVLREAGIVRNRLVGTYNFLSIRHEDLDARFPGLLDAILTAYQLDQTTFNAAEKGTEIYAQPTIE